jgi:predicted RND superfamily exporter protein
MEGQAMDRRRSRDIAIVGGAALLMALSLSMVGKLHVDSSTDVFLPVDDQVVETNERIEQTFGAMDVIAVGIQRIDGSYLLGDADLSAIGAITDRLATLEGVEAADSLSNARYPMADGDGLAVVPLARQGGAELEERLAEGKALYEGTLVSSDRTFCAVLIQPNGSAPDLVDRIRDVLALHSAQGYRFSLVGLPVVKEQIHASLTRDLLVLSPIVGLLIVLVLALSFRHPAGVLYPLLCLAFSFSSVLGIMALFSVTVTMATMLVPILLLIVGSAYCIHIMSHFYEQTATSETETAIETVVRRNRVPVIMAGATTAAGFIAQLASPLGPFRTFGVLSAIGVAVSQIAALSLLPALLRLSCRKKVSPHRKTRKGTGTIAVVIASVPARPLAILSVLLVLGTLLTVPRIATGTDMLGFFRKDSQLVSDTDLFNEKMDGSGVLTVMIGGTVLEPGFLLSLQEFQETFSERSEVGSVQTVVPYLVRINEIMNAAASSPRHVATDQELFDFFGTTPKPAEPQDRTEPTVTAEPSSFREIPSDPGKYGLATADELQDLLSQYLLLYAGNLSMFLDDELEPASTLAIIKLHPSDPETLRSLVADIEAYWEPRLESGWTMEIGGGEAVSLQLTDLVTRSQAYSLIGALAIVFLLVSLLFRSPFAGLLALVPPLYALMGIFFSMALCSIPLDIVTSLIAALAIGIGVDFGIHMLSACKRGDTMETILATTGQAIVTNAASVILGFSGLVFSNFLPIRQLGFLFSIAMACAAFSALTVLPRAVRHFDPRFLARSKP